MSREPHEYRVHAIKCAGLASSVKTPELQVMFSELSRGWENLARAIEDADDTSAQIDTNESSSDPCHSRWPDLPNLV